MSDISIDIKLTNIIKACYKKFKSYVYYSNNLINVKFKIINFEQKDDFEITFKNISKAIIDKDENYFDILIKKITWIPQIKTINNSSNNHCITNRKNDSDIVIDKINYFIDMPIELNILDTFWTILFGKSLFEKNILNKYTMANEFAYKLYSEENGIDGINFDSLEIYKPYFKNYQKWKSGAIKKVTSLYNQKKDSTIISLDLSGYFYSIEINFNDIYNKSSIFDYDFTFETSILEKVHKLYWNKLKKIKPSTKNNRVLPIGLISSGVLANYYLYDFDENIATNRNTEYYSRYVDDILIVISKIDKCLQVEDILKKYFSDFFLFEKDCIKIKNKPLCKIQKNKIKIIQNYSDSSRSLIESLKEEIPNPSEANLLPNIENVDLDNFLLEIYNKKSESIKIRENDGLELNKYKLIKFMSAYVISRKNTLFKNGKNNKYYKLDENIYSQLEIFFDNYNLFNLWDKWGKIFEFTYLNNSDFLLTFKLIEKIQSAIDNITINDDVCKGKIDFLTKKLKKTLYNTMVYSIAAVFSLKPNSSKSANKVVTKARKYVNKIRKANFMNHNLVGIPLINYINFQNYSNSDLYNIQESDLLKMEKTIEFDSKKFDYTPRFIHLGEYMLCRNLLSITELNDSKLLENILNDYKNITKIEKKFFDVKTIEKFDGEYILSTIKFEYNFEEKTLTNIYVALGNINLNKHELIKNNEINLFGYKTVKNKMILFKLLNDCIWIDKNELILDFGVFTHKYKFEQNKHVDFLVFPELYIPFEWLDYVMHFSRKNGIGVITGVKYCKSDKKLINSIATIIPFMDENKYKYSTIFMREKNDYSPDEISLITGSGYNNPTKNKSFNYIFSWNSISFSVLNCYELTDIKARAVLKSKVDIIFTPEYNRDISYFSNIIESTSRDDGCFVVQVNSSNIGDTRIVGPFSSNYANICSISGGEKDSIHIGKINIQEYNDYKKYEKKDKFRKEIRERYKCSKKNNKPDYSKYKKSSAKL